MSYAEWVRKKKGEQKNSGGAPAPPTANKASIIDVPSRQNVSTVSYADFVKRKKAEQPNSSGTVAPPVTQTSYTVSKSSGESPSTTSYADFVRRKKTEQPNSSGTVATYTTKSTYATSTSSDKNTSPVSYVDFVRKKKAESSADGWAKSAVSLLNEMQTQIQSWSYKNVHADYSSKISSLLLQADTWRKQYAGNEQATSYIDSVVSALSDAQQKSTQIAEAYTQWDSEETYNAALKKWQEYYDKYGHYAEEEDFEEYYNIGKTLSYEDFGSLTRKRGSGARRRGHYVIDDYRAAAIALYEHNGGEVDSFYTERFSGKIDLYRNMDEGEFKLLAYFIAKDKAEGTNLAKQYVNAMYDTLANRLGKEVVTNLDSINIPVIEDIAKLIHGWGGGFLNGLEGIIQYVTGYIFPTDESDYANMYISDSLDGIGWYAHQAAMSIGNMTPSLVVGAINPIAGAVTMGVSVAGNAYAQALDWGYNKTQARIYGTVVGTLEGGLQQALGGITKLSGGQAGKILSKIASIENMTLRILAKLGWSTVKEIGEEELQNYLEPLARSLILGEEYDAPTMEEMLETAIVTVMSTGALEGGDTYINDVHETSQINEQMTPYIGSQKELVGEALEIDPANAFAQKMQGKLDQGKQLSGRQLYRLVQQNEAALAAQDASHIQSAAENRLNQLGETGDIPAIAGVLAKRASGEKLNGKDWKILAGSKYGIRVTNELNPTNIRSGQYSSAWAESIGTERINTEAYNRLVKNSYQLDEPAIPSVITNASIPQNAQTSPENTEQTPVEYSFEPIAIPELWRVQEISNNRVLSDAEGLHQISSVNKSSIPRVDEPVRPSLETTDAQPLYQNHTEKSNGEKQSLRDVNIGRVFLQYGDTAAEKAAIGRSTADLVEKGKVVTIRASNVEIHKGNISNDKKATRAYIRKLLKKFMGSSVFFEHNNQFAEAYLTSIGIDHSVGGVITAERAAIFEKFEKLIQNAQYSFSSKNDLHSTMNKRVGGQIDWDTFVAVASIENNLYSVVFRIRTIDTDIRSQIYEMSVKKETDGSRDPGQQHDPPHGMSSYGVVPSISEKNVAQPPAEVKKKEGGSLPFAATRNETGSSHNGGQFRNQPNTLLNYGESPVSNGTALQPGSVVKNENQQNSEARAVLGELTQQERSALSTYQNQLAHLQSLEQQRQVLLQQREALQTRLSNGTIDRNALSQNATQLSRIEGQIAQAEANLRQAMGTKTLSNLMQKLQSVDIVANIENNSQNQTNVLEKSPEHGIMNTEREQILQLGAKQKDLVEGKEVYWDNKTFDPYRKDWLGRTNIQRMQKGLAPIGHDGKSVNIHHIDQTDDGPVVEISATEHSKHTKILHDNTGQKPSQINRSEFNKWRYRYWKWRSQYWDTGG